MRGNKLFNKLTSAALAAALTVTTVLSGFVMPTTVSAASKSDYTCGYTEEHTHVAGCYKTDLTCKEKVHTHSDKCYKEVTTCTLEEHSHGLFCGWWCTKPVHKHNKDCKARVLNCKTTEHTHSDACYTTSLKCKKTEHTHEFACYATSSEQYKKNSIEFVYDASLNAGVNAGINQVKYAICLYNAAGQYVGTIAADKIAAEYKTITKTEVTRVEDLTSVLPTGAIEGYTFKGIYFNYASNDTAFNLTDYVNVSAFVNMQMKSTQRGWNNYLAYNATRTVNGVAQNLIDKDYDNKESKAIAYNPTGTLRIIYQANSYDLTVEDQFAANTTTTTSVGYTNTVTVPSPAGNVDYDFIRWDADMNGDGVVDATYATGATFSMPANDVTLTAVYSAEKTYTYTIHYVTYVEGEAVTVAPDATVTGVYGTSVNVTSPDVTGYHLASADDATIVDTIAHADNEIYVEYAINSYDITFINGTTTVSSGTYNHGATVTVPADPTKAATDEYTYTFIGWDSNNDGVADEVSATAVADATYIALYSSVVNTYTVIWKVEGVAVETDENVPYGTIPSYDGVTPTKAQTESTVYTFTGWDSNITVAITGDTTFNAVFDESDRIYTITWVDEDGTVFTTTSVAYGQVAEYPNEDPTKAEDNYNTYNFAGWDVDGNGSADVLPAVTGNATYTAVYTPVKKYYTVKFVNAAGTEISTQVLGYGETVVVPEKPTYDGDSKIYTYSFRYWDSNNDGKKDEVVTSCDGDATYVAVYKHFIIIRYFKYHAVVDVINEFYDQDGIDGRPVAHFSAVGASQYYYVGTETFNALETILTDVYNKTATDKRPGTIDQDIIKEVIGLTETASQTNAADVWYVIKLESDGWHIDGGDYNDYIVEFKNGETTLQKATYHIGDAVNYEAAYPTKPDSATPEDLKTYTYTFKGWDREVVKTCDGDAVYYAEFDSEYINYTVTFYDEDGKTVIAEKKDYHYGDATVVPADPTKAADDTYTYNFAGWDHPVETVVTKNDSYIASYDNQYVTYTVNFFNEDKTTVSSKADYHYNDATVIPADPTKAADSAYTYTFLGWDVDADGKVDEVAKNVTKDLDYYAVYAATAIDYTITFFDEDGETVISKKTDYHYGDKIIVPADPTKAATKEYTYTFSGWNKEVAETVTGNDSYIATYASDDVTYTVIFNNEDGTTISGKSDYHYNDATVIPANPTKAADSTYTYSFLGWDVDGNGSVDEVAEKVTENAVYTAVYTKKYIDYTVTFYDEDGVTVIATKNDYHYGEATVIPADPTKAATESHTYTFSGWNKEVAVIVTGNDSYVATYTSDDVTYRVIFKDEDGSTISGKSDYLYGDATVIPADPTKAADEVFNYTFAGWDANNDGEVDTVATTVTKNAEYVAVYEAEFVKYTVNFFDEDGSLISSNVYNYGDTVVVPADPTKPATEAVEYTFAGWNYEVIMIVVADADYVATYEGTPIEVDDDDNGEVEGDDDNDDDDNGEVEGDDDNGDDDNGGEVEGDDDNGDDDNGEVEPDDDVDTADVTDLGLLLSLLGVSVVALGTVFMKKRSDKKNEE